MESSAGSSEATDVAVVGAGPAGLMAAIASAERGHRVLVLEQLASPGRKLLATGGGRCNLANTLPPEEFMARFGRQGRFMQPALAAMDADGLRRFFDALGVPTHAPDGVHVYPVSEKAADVLDALRRRMKTLGGVVRTRVRVTGLAVGNGTLQGLETDRGPVAARHVVVATGGRGYPVLGATGTGYALARQAGHTMVEPTPALVPLVTRETWPAECAGVALPAARVRIDLPRQAKAGRTGDVLLTHTGLSGPAVLDLSGDVAAMLAHRPTVPLRLDLVPGTTHQEWIRRFDRWQESDGARTLGTLLGRHVPRSLAKVLCRLAGIDPGWRPGRLTRPLRRTLADLLTALPLTVTGTEGWDRAMVTRGGVALKEVDPATLGSRRLPGLAFAGEILDLDGPSGGFNLQWAFASGHLAGRSMVAGAI